MTTRVFYSGDVNIEHGGMFYSFKDWRYGYASVVRVTPCSDAGGPDNCFWIDVLTVNIREGDKLDPILDCYGAETLPKGAALRHFLIDAHVSYGAYDQESSEMIQIGAKQDSYARHNGSFNPDRILRGNSSLRRYARDIARQECES